MDIEELETLLIRTEYIGAKTLAREKWNRQANRLILEFFKKGSLRLKENDDNTVFGIVPPDRIVIVGTLDKISSLRRYILNNPHPSMWGLDRKRTDLKIKE